MRLRPLGIAMIALTTAITASLFAIAPASADDTGNTATDALSLTANMPTTTAMFTPSNIVPGQSGSNTITAKAGAVRAVKVYAANVSDPSQIAQYFTLTITEGTKKKRGHLHRGRGRDRLHWQPCALPHEGHLLPGRRRHLGAGRHRRCVEDLPDHLDPQPHRSRQNRLHQPRLGDPEHGKR